VVGRAHGIVKAALLALSAAAASCFGHLPPCPAAGGPAWTELESAHFRLRTDEPPAQARAALTDLERLEAALLFLFEAPPDLDTGRVPVVLVDRGWTDFAPRQIGGYTFGSVLFQPLIVMASVSALAREELIKHELVHYLSLQVIPRQPPWLSEGLATYYQSIEYDAASGRVTVGRPPPDLLRVAQQFRAASVESIFSARAIDGDDASHFYADAWLTVHYLMNHRRTALNSYEDALHDGASLEAAWTEAFGAQTPAALALEVQRYLDGGQYALLTYHLPAREPPAAAERRLTDADVHATRALLYLTGAQTRADAPELAIAPEAPLAGARREVEAALRQDPDHVVAGAIAHFVLKAPLDVAKAAALSQRHGDDWLAWLLLAVAREEHGDRDGSKRAGLKALELSRSDRSIQLRGPLARTN
jgi:hypothetical protein